MSTPHKRKACKGTYKTNYYKGCGELVFAFKFGLCHACFVEWCYATGEGSEYLKKYVIPQAKKEVKKKERTKIKKQLQALETKTEVEKKLEKEINTIVRLIDKGHPCISSGRNLGKNYDAGHFWSKGSNPQIRFHLFNIFAQSVHDNQHKGSNALEYQERLGTVFTPELREYCLALKGTPSLKLSKEELRDKIVIAKRIVKWLKLQDREFSTKERIELRLKFQEELGIYKN
jgi:hypothetical protein